MIIADVQRPLDDPHARHGIGTRHALVDPHRPGTWPLAGTRRCDPAGEGRRVLHARRYPRAPEVFTKTLRLTQAGQKLERVKIVPGAEPAAVEISAPNCEVAWCEVTGFAARGIVVQKGGTNAHIHHNWVHDQAPLVGAAVAGIIAGTGRGTTADSMKAL